MKNENLIRTKENRVYTEEFRKSVTAYPDAVAVRDESGCFTYEELDAVSDVLARLLLHNGVVTGSRIVAYVPRVREIALAAIGAWKAGCVYIPVDYSYPQGRANYIFEDSCAEFVLTVRKAWEDKPLDVRPDQVILLDELMTIDMPAADGPLPEISEGMDAYVIYTSGSTGNPKGVLHTHRSLYALASWQPETEEPMDGSSLYCNVTGFSFIPSIIDIFSPLLCGAGTLIASEATQKDIRRLYKLICDNNVTILLGTTRLVTMLLETYDMRPFALRMGGERVTRFHALYPSTVTQLYGLSEGCFPVYGRISGSEDPMPLGRIRDGIRFDLLDENGQSVPAGETGELVYSGDIMAEEYLNLPDMTREKWVERDGVKWLRTGDLMRMDEDGTLYYVQRRDFIIKVRGFRIEPGEIENRVLSESDGKITSAVCVSRQVGGEDRLCLYYEASEDIDTDELKKRLSGSLTEYMIPDIIIRMDRLPRNPNGKLDRLHLPDPVSDDEALTSLAMMRIAAEAYEQYGITLEFKELFRAGTRENIQALIEQKKNTGEKPAEHDVPVAETAPLGFSQAGVYSECLSAPDSLMYNLPMMLSLPGDVTADALENAVRRVLDAHPCVCACIDGDCVRRLEWDRTVPRRKITEKELPAYKASAVRTFDLKGHEPLFRIEIVETEDRLYLFSDFHHLIFDGSSYNLFYTELVNALSGREITEEKFTAMQLASEQDELRSSMIYEETMKYWGERILGLSSASEIPADRYDTPPEAGMERRVREEVCVDNVRALARRLHVNTSAVYLSSFLLTVAAYTAEEDVGIMTVSSGRSDLRIAKSFGMFVNTVPVTASVRFGKTSDYIREVQETLLGAIEHERCAFSDIAARFSYKPGIMFAGQEGLVENQDLARRGFTVENLETGTAKFPVYMAVTGENDDIALEIRYDENRYSEDMMREMCHVTAYVLEQLCEEEDMTRIRFCDDDQLAVLDGFNPAAEPFTETETIVSMFRKTAEEYPDNAAVVFRDEVLSYRQLDDVTDRLAKHIGTHITGKNASGHEPVVSILVHRGLEMVICALGALKAGCAYQPLDPDYPAERIAYMIKDAQPVLLLADPDCLKPEITPECEVLDTGGINDLPDPGEALRAKVSPEDLFILLYTSGSTGKPKGVMLEHQNLTAFCRWYRRYYDLKPEHKVAGYASFGFDACMMDMYPALTTGACLHIIPEDMRLDLNAINDYFEKNNITHSFMTTQVGVQFHQMRKNHSLLHFSVGGEKLVSVRPGDTYTLHNAYGPTECTIFTTTMPVQKQEPNIPIGRPVDSLKCFVVDSHLRRLPIGAAGELLIRGAQVGRGYLNLPEKTSEAFFMQEGERVYRTGDIVRYRSNGDIEFAGRKDGQVKIRGFRVEQREIEAVIREFEGIRDVTVQAFDAPEGGKYLAAYIVCSDSLRTEDLKAHILASKPAYMLPASIMRLPAIPLNINQKVDRKSLPAPVFSAEEDYVEPETDNERIVADAIARVTGVQGRVSALDGFSVLGGDSINALRLSTELSKSHLEITPNLILRLDTVREIAKAAVSSDPDAGQSSGHFTGRIDNTAIVQYFYDLKLPEPGYFNQAMMYKAGSKIDMELLSKALDTLVRHHDMLRAVSRDGGLFVREPSGEMMFELIEDQEDNLENRVDALNSSFDIENGPLIRACVFRGQQCDYLLIVIHHLVVDGISWRILTEDLNTAYAAEASGREAKLPAEKGSYKDYADALSLFRRSTALISQKPYWETIRERLEKLPCTDRSTGLPRFERLDLRIDSGLTETLLTQCSAAFHNRLNDIFLAALGMSYHGVTGETSVAVRLEGHGREGFDPDLNIDRTVGWFTSIYPVILEHLDQEAPAVIRETKETLRRIPQNGFGYGPLYGIETERMPLMTFNYLGRMSENVGDGMFTLSEDHPAGNSIALSNCYGTDINLNGQLIGDGIFFFIDYNSLRYTRDQMKQLAEGFSGALGKIAEYLRTAGTPAVTASDLGELEWTDAEFDFITRDFGERGEKILRIYPMSRTMMRSFRRSILAMDDHPDIIRASIQIDGSFSGEMFSDTLKELYDLHEDLRYAIAFYGVSTPRIVATDRKPEMMYLDLSAEKDPHQKMAEVRSDLDWFVIDLQLHALMQLTVIKTAEKEHFLLFAFNKVLYDLPSARTRIDDYLRLLAGRQSEVTNIAEWRDYLRVGMIRTLSQKEDTECSAGSSPAVPKSDSEWAVARMFGALLDTDSETLSPESDFFELGGDKYMSVELSDMLLEAYDRVVPPVIICKNSTVRAIAALIEEGDLSDANTGALTDSNEDIHIYSSHSGKKNLFFVHTANTGSEAYYKLARYIENDYSFAVFEQYNINHPGNPKEDIPSLAAKYIEVLKRIQPEGPYCLGGWCFGGSVAYEMARQLTMACETVEKLILLDSHIIETPQLRKKLVDSSVKHSREYISTAPLFEGIRKKGLLERYIANASRSSRIWLEYDPPEYNGSVMYIKATVKAEGLTDASDEMYNCILKQKAAGFEKRVPADQLKIVEVSKDHDSLMDDDALMVIVPAITDYLKE